MKNIKENLKNAYVSLHYKVRNTKTNLPEREIIGLFVNFIYQHVMNCHGTLSSYDFQLSFIFGEIPKITCNETPNKNLKDLLETLNSFTDQEIISIWYSTLILSQKPTIVHYNNIYEFQQFSVKNFLDKYSP